MEKTLYLDIGKETTYLKLNNNELIITYELWKYLGTNFNKEGTEDPEIKSMINKARQITKFLNGIR